jgi:excisionase family DNA binding protein
MAESLPQLANVLTIGELQNCNGRTRTNPSPSKKVTYLFGLPLARLDNAYLLTTQQATQHVGVHIDSFREWVPRRPVTRIALPVPGKDYRFSRKALNQWVKEPSLKGG